MKASELIKHLEQLIDEHGDLDARVWDHDENQDYPMGKVEYRTTGHHGEDIDPTILISHVGYWCENN